MPPVFLHCSELLQKIALQPVGIGRNSYGHPHTVGFWPWRTVGAWSSGPSKRVVLDSMICGDWAQDRKGAIFGWCAQWLVVVARVPLRAFPFFFCNTAKVVTFFLGLVGTGGIESVSLVVPILKTVSPCIEIPGTRVVVFHSWNSACP
eukprot:2734740-Rhodomonas_salina.1